MSRRIKIAANLREPNKRVDRANGRTCLRSCPILSKRTDDNTLVTFRQIRFCPIRAICLQDDTAPCDYGRRAIAVAAVQQSRLKAESRQTHEKRHRSAAKWNR